MNQKAVYCLQQPQEKMLSMERVAENGVRKAGPSQSSCSEHYISMNAAQIELLLFVFGQGVG